VKFGTNTADTLGRVVSVDTDIYNDDHRQLMWDIATVINQELRALVAAGCRVVQIEDPTLHGAAFFGVDQDEIDFLVDLFNHEVSGLEEAEVWVHTCWGNPGAQGMDKETRVYTDHAIETHFRLKIDVLNVESKSLNHEPLRLFKRFKGNLPVKVAPGFISHRVLQVESPQEVADDIRGALEFIDAEDLVLTSDCGFGRQGASRPIALYKASALAQGANIVRRELGGEEREIPALDPMRQIDPSPLAPVG
jgi:5-methyltetrahydropteroyltriglutamate--homocysteine methyltransferase